MSSYNNYYNKRSSNCNKEIGPQGAQGPIGPQGPLGPIGPAGESQFGGPQGPTGPQGSVGANGVGNISVGQYSGSNVDFSYQNINTLLFDSSSGLTVDLCNNILTDISSVLISLGGSFKYWDISGSNILEATGQDTIKFISGSNINFDSSNNSNPKSFTINALPQLSTEIIDGSNTLILQSGFNFCPTDACGQDLGSITRPWGTGYFDNSTIYLGQTRFSASNDGKFKVNDKELFEDIAEDLQNHTLILDISNEITSIKQNITKNSNDITNNLNNINNLNNRLVSIENRPITDSEQVNANTTTLQDLSSHVYGLSFEQADLTDLSNQVSVNTSNIQDLSGYVYGLSFEQADLTDLSNQVSVNTSSIIDISSSVNQNYLLIQDLSTTLYDFSNIDIVDLSYAIIHNTLNIQNNATNIQDLSSALHNTSFGDILDISNQVSVNTSNIQDLSGYVYGLSFEQADLTNILSDISDISTNLTDLSGEIHSKVNINNQDILTLTDKVHGVTSYKSGISPIFTNSNQPSVEILKDYYLIPEIDSLQNIGHGAGGGVLSGPLRRWNEGHFSGTVYAGGFSSGGSNEEDPNEKITLNSSGITIQTSKEDANTDSKLRSYTITSDLLGERNMRSVIDPASTYGRLVISPNYSDQLKSNYDQGGVDISGAYLRIINNHKELASSAFSNNQIDLELFQIGNSEKEHNHVTQLFTIGSKSDTGVYKSQAETSKQSAIVLEPTKNVLTKLSNNNQSNVNFSQQDIDDASGYSMSFYIKSDGLLTDTDYPAMHISNRSTVSINAPTEINDAIIVNKYLQLKSDATIIDNNNKAYAFRQLESTSQISGYIQTQFKNTEFSDYIAPSYLNPANSYDLNIIPTQKDNNIVTNIRLNYITSGQPGEKLRIQIGFNVFSLNYEEIIGDETIGTINTSNLEQTYSFTYINKSIANVSHYYWVKVQRVNDGTVYDLDSSSQTRIINKPGNLIMLQEVIGSNIVSGENTNWSVGNNNSLNYSQGNVGINASNPDEKLVVDGNIKIIGSNNYLNIPSNPPLNYNSPGKKGDITWDEKYFYVCINNNLWKRSIFFTEQW